MIKVADYIVARVVDAGARDIFLVPGGAAMHLNDALARTPGLTYVATFHEHAAAVAAESYAKLTNRLGAAMVTAGPGSTNAVTGVASAWVNSAPLVVIAGQVKRADLKGADLRQLGLQEIDAVAIVAPITKYAVTLTDPSTARYHVEKALYLARSGRPGPVWITVPLDVQPALIQPEEQAGFTPDPPRPHHELEQQVDRIIALLNDAERPVLLAGYGIRGANSEGAFLQLLDVLGIPVQTTWVGADLVAADHPLYAGRPGSFASRGANFTIQNCDFLLAIGARFDLATVGFSRERFARAANRIAVDVDPAEIDKMRSALTFGVVADARDVIDALLAKRHAIRTRDRTDWHARVSAWVRDYPVVTPDMRDRPAGISTYVLVEKLGALLDEDDVIVEGSSGIHSEIFFMAFDVKRGQRIMADGSYGAMGYGVPAVIGACVAAGRRRTVLVEGDGSLQPNLQELQTIARERLPIKIIVVNNRGYSSIRSSQSRYFQRLVAADETSGLTLPEVSRIADAYGIRYVRVEEERLLEDVLRTALSGDDPVLCEVIVPPEEDRVPRVANLQRKDGTMVSKPLEDMFPFLERDEFLRNMIIDPVPED